MKCRRCENEIESLWHGWELCDNCGYRFYVETQQSPDNNDSSSKTLADQK